MPDEMFFSKDERSLVRGNRIAQRTDTCRPCMITVHDDSNAEYNGVVLDITPHGMLIRVMATLPMGVEVTVQLMRDEKFTKNLSTPRQAKVIRLDGADDGFFDYGIEITNASIQHKESRPITIEKPAAQRKKPPSRMHSLDVTIGGNNTGRFNR